MKDRSVGAVWLCGCEGSQWVPSQIWWFFVKKQELVDEILKGRLFSMYQKQSARNAAELAIRLAKKTTTEGTKISSAETSLTISTWGRRLYKGTTDVLE